MPFWEATSFQNFTNTLYVLQDDLSQFESSILGLVDGQLRGILAPRVYTLPLVRSIGKTMVQGKNYGPHITVKRLAMK